LALVRLFMLRLLLIFELLPIDLTLLFDTEILAEVLGGWLLPYAIRSLFFLI
jgi:hypothetical protein